MKDVTHAVKSSRLGSLAIIAPMALGMMGALGSAAHAFTVSGSVSISATGAGVGGVTVVAMNRATRISKTATTAANGSYTITAVPGGSTFVYAFITASQHHNIREVSTGQNPATIQVDGPEAVIFKQFGLDNAKPVVDVIQPAASAGTPIAPPLVAKCTAIDFGDDTDGDGVADRPKAGIGQVVMGIGRDPDPFFGIPAQLYNFVTKQWENTPSSVSGGFTPSNFGLARFLKPATFVNGSWRISLPQTDGAGSPVFSTGHAYLIGAGAVDKAGNADYDAAPGTFTIQ